ncbi:MAG: hypothetical protein HFH45_06585, partial [Bacilli bacterium]|nr:hypothetical protein [Bacilli bacterium]
SEDITLYAIYKKELTVTYTKGANISSISKESDKCYIYNNNTACEITLPSITAKGYRILGWYNGNTKIGDSNSKYNITGNITLNSKVIDDIKPSTPTITNASNGKWSSNDVTVKITSIDEGSGIDHYEWYENGAWTNRAITTTNGVGTIIYTVNRNETIRFRAIDKVGNVSSEASTTVKIDKNNPTLSIATSKTTKSITVVATASAYSGITKYEFSNNGGSSWVNGGTNKTYTFNGLKNNTAYNIRARVTSGVSKQTTSATTSVTTNNIAVPTYKETQAAGKSTVTITYPSGCGTTYTCTYTKSGGSAVTVKSTTATVTFTAAGSVTGKVSDGTNTVSSSYTPTIKYGVSPGTVRGGSITLSKTLATHSDTVTFTTSPSSGFTYQGATVVCNNSTSQTLNSSTKSFKVTNTGCTQATVYPTWKKNDLKMLNNETPTQVNNPINWSGNLFDGYKMSVTLTQKYYVYFDSASSNNARAQVTSVGTVDLTDYKTFRALASCWSGIRAVTAFAGVTKNRSDWLHGVTTKVQFSIPQQTGNGADVNINNLTGNYYLAFQILTNDQSTNCYFSTAELWGKTYNYTNRS